MERIIWNPATDPDTGGDGENRLHIGQALVDAGLVTKEQVDAALERQRRQPYFILGQFISFLYRIPSKTIDTVYLRSMVFPVLAPEVMRRLEQVVQRDRFARQMVPRSFIRQVEIIPQSYEVMLIESRDYGPPTESPESPVEERGVKRYVLSQGHVEVHLHLNTHSDDGSPLMVKGIVQFRHDSVSRTLIVAEDEDQLKTALYYELRNIFNKLGG